VELALRKASNTIESTNLKGDSNALTDAKRDGVRKYKPRLEDVRIALFFLFFLFRRLSSELGPSVSQVILEHL